MCDQCDWNCLCLLAGVYGRQFPTPHKHWEAGVLSFSMTMYYGDLSRDLKDISVSQSIHTSKESIKNCPSQISKLIFQGSVIKRLRLFVDLTFGLTQKSIKPPPVGYHAASLVQWRSDPTEDTEIQNQTGVQQCASMMLKSFTNFPTIIERQYQRQTFLYSKEDKTE